MENLIVIVIVAIIMMLAAGYIYKAKKSGKKCIGCPDGCCSKLNQGSSCSCCCGEKNS